MVIKLNRKVVKEAPTEKIEVEAPNVQIKGTKRGYEVTVTMRKRYGYYRSRRKTGWARSLAGAEKKAAKYSRILMREEYKERSKHALLAERGY